MRRMLQAVAAVAALAVAAGCAPTASTPPSPSSAGASTVPSPTAPADAPGPLVSALLTAEDLGEGYTANYDLQGDDHGSIPMMMSYCGETDYSEAGQHAVEFRTGSVYRDDEHFVLMIVTRYDDDTSAGRHLNDLRAVLPRCAQVPIMGNLDDVATLTVVDNDFAGDGSLLVREERGAVTQYHGAVWRGDVEALLRIHTGASQSQARDLVTAAADRLCRATATC